MNIIKSLDTIDSINTKINQKDDEIKNLRERKQNLESKIIYSLLNEYDINLKDIINAVNPDLIKTNKAEIETGGESDEKSDD